MNRRNTLLTLISGFLLISGCSDSPRGETKTGTPSSTPTAALSDLYPEALLPQEGDGWRHVNSKNYTWTHLGADDGIKGYYEKDGALRAEVIIMKVSDDGAGSTAEREARTLYCQAGWQVVVVRGPFAVAASTGTPRKSFTPEAPPTMDQTAISESEDAVVTLLSNSPRLSREMIADQRLRDSDC